MYNHIEARIEHIAEELRRRAMEQEWPLDDLSASLYEMGRELAGLDAQGKAALLEELNTPSADGTAGLNLTMQDLEKMIGEML